MLEFIGLLFIGCFWVWGVNYLFKKKEILGKLGEWMRANWPKWLNKPLFNCPACQSSVHGSIIYFCGLHFNQLPLFAENNYIIFWPFFCICMTGINHILIEHLYDTTE
jgi:hypothetical protein